MKSLKRQLLIEFSGTFILTLFILFSFAAGLPSNSRIGQPVAALVIACVWMILLLVFRNNRHVTFNPTLTFTEVLTGTIKPLSALAICGVQTGGSFVAALFVRLFLKDFIHIRYAIDKSMITNSDIPPAISGMIFLFLGGLFLGAAWMIYNSDEKVVFPYRIRFLLLGSVICIWLVLFGGIHPLRILVTELFVSKWDKLFEHLSFLIKNGKSSASYKVAIETLSSDWRTTGGNLIALFTGSSLGAVAARWKILKKF